MREKMHGKIVFFPPEWAIQPSDVFMMKVLFSKCTLTWRVTKFVSRQEKVQTGETIVQKGLY